MRTKMHPSIDEERQKLARRYRRDNLVVSIMSYAVTACFLIALLYFDISRNFVDVLHNAITSRFVLILVYFSALFILYSLISFPFAYQEGYVIEHAYGFSTQTRRAWFIDWLKSCAVGFVLGALVFEFIYCITSVAPRTWWFWFSLLMVIFTVVLNNLFPVLIVPLFYKTSPIEHDSLREQIGKMCSQAGISLQGVYSINLSSKSTKANAAVVGLGGTKRILIGDTLMNDYREPEVLTTLAHEITHYKEHHMWWLILWQSLVTFVVFYVFSRIYPYFYRLSAFKDISDVAAFPAFAILFAVLSFITRPLGSSISRYYERKADRGALTLTKDRESFISLMAKFCNTHLLIAYPHPLIEWYSYSHPSSGKRIAFAEAWQSQ